ncbi:MAG TPA: exopolysaccharide biosynthesis protein, partial [Candidatus Manganitrophaceae bacterium]
KILDHANGRAVTLREVIEVLHGRGLDVLIIMLALPFCTPIPLPGLSTLFGAVLMFFGLRIALRKRPWLPHRLLQKEIPYTTLAKIIKAALAAANRLEKVLHPRMRFFKNWTSFNTLNGLAMMSSGFVLMLPLPIPFTNTLPAWSIVLLAAGMMEEDGAVIVAGYVMAGLTWIYLISLGWLGNVGLGWFGA